MKNVRDWLVKVHSEKEKKLGNIQPLQDALKNFRRLLVLLETRVFTAGHKIQIWNKKGWERILLCLIMRKMV